MSWDSQWSEIYNKSAGGHHAAVFSEIGRLSNAQRVEYDQKLDSQQEAARVFGQNMVAGRDGQVGMAKQEILNGAAIRQYAPELREERAQTQAEHQVDAKNAVKMQALAEQHLTDRVQYLQAAQSERLEATSTLKGNFDHQADFDLGE